MDGHFVPNITFGPPVVASVRKITDCYLDVHLMIEHPERFVQPFLDAGSDRITVHVEACSRPRELLAGLREAGRGAGITLKPATPFAQVRDLLDIADLLLVMTVEPGFGGQKLLPDCVAKVREACAFKAQPGRDTFWIEVDGGVNSDTIQEVAAAGAEIIVAGSAVFGAGNRKAAFDELLVNAQKGRTPEGT